MKVRCTGKQIKDGARVVYAAPYCSLQNALAAAEPFAYGCGVYGWNWDAYEIAPGVVLTTGYRAIGTKLPREMLESIEGMAREINAERGAWDAADECRELLANNLEYLELNGIC